MTLSIKRPSKGDEMRQRIMEQVTEGVEKKRRFNADIPESLLRRMKIRGLEEGRSVAEITRELWHEYLSK